MHAGHREIGIAPCHHGMRSSGLGHGQIQGKANFVTFGRFTHLATQHDGSKLQSITGSPHGALCRERGLHRLAKARCLGRICGPCDARATEDHPIHVIKHASPQLAPIGRRDMNLGRRPQTENCPKKTATRDSANRIHFWGVGFNN